MDSEFLTLPYGTGEEINLDEEFKIHQSEPMVRIEFPQDGGYFNTNEFTIVVVAYNFIPAVVWLHKIIPVPNSDETEAINIGTMHYTQPIDDQAFEFNLNITFDRNDVYLLQARAVDGNGDVEMSNLVNVTIEADNFDIGAGEMGNLNLSNDDFVPAELPGFVAQALKEGAVEFEEDYLTEREEKEQKREEREQKREEKKAEKESKEEKEYSEEEREAKKQKPLRKRQPGQRARKRPALHKRPTGGSKSDEETLNWRAPKVGRGRKQRRAVTSEEEFKGDDEKEFKGDDEKELKEGYASDSSQGSDSSQRGRRRLYQVKGKKKYKNRGPSPEPRLKGAHRRGSMGQILDRNKVRNQHAYDLLKRQPVSTCPGEGEQSKEDYSQFELFCKTTLDDFAQHLTSTDCDIKYPLVMRFFESQETPGFAAIMSQSTASKTKTKKPKNYVGESYWIGWELPFWINANPSLLHDEEKRRLLILWILQMRITGGKQPFRQLSNLISTYYPDEKSRKSR